MRELEHFIERAVILTRGAELEVSLAGEWTPELERCWRYTTAALQPASVSLDLTEVTFVDDAGKQLLVAMAQARVKLIAADVQMHALVEQIARRLAGLDCGERT